MKGAEQLRVEVAYATPARQEIVALMVPVGTTASDAVRLSGLLDRFEVHDRDALELGVFGRVVPADRVLVEGDRVEVYRPLQADPREVRRKLAAEGRTMGRGRGTAGD